MVPQRSRVFLIGGLAAGLLAVWAAAWFWVMSLYQEPVVTQAVGGKTRYRFRNFSVTLPPGWFRQVDDMASNSRAGQRATFVLNTRPGWREFVIIELLPTTEGRLNWREVAAQSEAPGLQLGQGVIAGRPAVTYHFRSRKRSTRKAQPDRVLLWRAWETAYRGYVLTVHAACRADDAEGRRQCDEVVNSIRLHFP